MCCVLVQKLEQEQKQKNEDELLEAAIEERKQLATREQIPEAAGAAPCPGKGGVDSKLNTAKAGPVSVKVGKPRLVLSSAPVITGSEPVRTLINTTPPPPPLRARAGDTIAQTHQGRQTQIRMNFSFAGMMRHPSLQHICEMLEHALSLRPASRVGEPSPM